MERELSDGMTEINMIEISLKMNTMEKVISPGIMDANSKVNGTTEKKPEMDN
jgi:hypothetical protein